MSDAEKIALTKTILDQGMPTGSPLDILVASRSSLIVPMIEARIEEILKSPSPRDCFIDKTSDPQVVVQHLWLSIAHAGDLQALREASKLLKLDEQRFDRMVGNTMSAAISCGNCGNAFTVAYHGFELGDPAIDKRLAVWAKEILEDEVPKVGTIYDDVPNTVRRRWADALVERYGGVPTTGQLADDPIASRLSPKVFSALHKDVLRFATEAVEKRTPK